MEHSLDVIVKFDKPEGIGNFTREYPDDTFNVANNIVSFTVKRKYASDLNYWCERFESFIEKHHKNLSINYVDFNGENFNSPKRIFEVN